MNGSSPAQQVARMVLFLALLVGFALPAAADQSSEFSATEVLRGLPVQSGGRLKPLDTLARESVRLVTGKAEFGGTDPVITLLSWWANPEITRSQAVIEFRDLKAKAELGLNPDLRCYSLDELTANSKLNARRESIHQRLQGDEELQGNDKKVQDLLLKMNTLAAAMDGSLIQGVPNPKGLSEPWGSFSDLDQSEVIALAQPAKTSLTALREALKEKYPGKLQATAIALRSQLRELGPVPDDSAIAREIRYNSSHPFGKAWMLYLAGFLVLAFIKPNDTRTNGYWAGVSLVAAGFLIHIYGFALRCMIAGRPPVTNMYESVIWVAFGAVLFAFVLEWKSAKRYFLMSATAGAIVCLILADTLPTVLDPSIHPLTPVLRSNFWLTIHVLCITLGYAAFLLALGLGHTALWKSALRRTPTEQLNSLHDSVYKAMQIGVLFLAAGTILGGVWANDSWGRFWGWDPKEVWALIALLGYLAILHGRYAGWLRKFGVTAWSVIAFQGVLMAWYGVNYILGAGLHSYGFGTGDSRYVGVFVAFEVAFVGWACWRHRNAPAPVADQPVAPLACPVSALSQKVKSNQGDTPHD